MFMFSSFEDGENIVKLMRKVYKFQLQEDLIRQAKEPEVDVNIINNGVGSYKKIEEPQLVHLGSLPSKTGLSLKRGTSHQLGSVDLSRELRGLIGQSRPRSKQRPTCQSQSSSSSSSDTSSEPTPAKALSNSSTESIEQKLVKERTTVRHGHKPMIRKKKMHKA